MYDIGAWAPVEGDAAGYSGYVPQPPTIPVTGGPLEELTSRAKEAVCHYWKTPESRTAPVLRYRGLP